MTAIRFITKDEVPEFRRAIAFGFGADLPDDDDGDERFLALFPLETSMAAFDDDRIVATSGAFDLDLTVPGGFTPMAGTTIVTVQPTHRRRGLLTEMMQRHLSQAMERGNPIAGLWASETLIYGRFGYADAAYGHDLTIPTDRVRLPAGGASVRLRTIDPEVAMDILPPLYDHVRQVTPGLFARSQSWWEHRRLRDSEHRRDGASSRRIVVAYRSEQPVGYVAYRQKEKWDDDLPNGIVEIIEVIALDDDARRALWHFLTNIDLYPNVHWWNAPVDYPLYAEVDHPRHVATKHRDTLWLRILDIPQALEARTYDRDGETTVAVTDGFMDAAGTYQLRVEDGRATCRRTEQTGDIRCDVTDLAHLYLGGGSAYMRWRAGLIDGSERAIRELDGMFRTVPAPYCGEVF